MLSVLIVAGCFSIACWTTTSLVKLFAASIATDFPYALGIGQKRHGIPMDAKTEWKGRDSLLAFVLSPAQTWRGCPSIGEEDRLVALDAHRVLVIPAITTKDKFGESTEWPLDKGQIRACENGENFVREPISQPCSSAIRRAGVPNASLLSSSLK
jgi:hypothetical protein